MKILGYQNIVNNIFPGIVGYVFNSIKFDNLGYLISYSPGIGFRFREDNIDRLITVHNLFKYYKPQLKNMLCIYVERRFMDRDRRYETYVRAPEKSYLVTLVDRNSGIVELADLTIDSLRLRPSHPIRIGIINFLGIISAYKSAIEE